jgi:hypothetical protein
MTYGIIDLLSTSFSQYSLIWLLISAGIGALIAASVKFVFEQTLPEWQRKRATRIAIQKYSFPLLQSAYNLENTMDALLRGLERITSGNTPDYIRLRVLYFFGSFFGWCRILSNESIIEYAELSQKIKSKNVERFAIHYNMLFKGISHLSYFRDIKDIPSASSQSARIPALVSTAIGDLMIKESTGGKELFSLTINFLEFTRKYEQDQDFRKWFEYIDNVLSDMKQIKSNAKWNRIVLIYIHLRVFIDFLERNRSYSALYGWTVYDYLQKISKVLFRRKDVPMLIVLDTVCNSIDPKIRLRLDQDLCRLGYKITYR